MHEEHGPLVERLNELIRAGAIEVDEACFLGTVVTEVTRGMLPSSPEQADALLHFPTEVVLKARTWRAQEAVRRSENRLSEQGVEPGAPPMQDDFDRALLVADAELMVPLLAHDAPEFYALFWKHAPLLPPARRADVEALCRAVAELRGDTLSEVSREIAPPQH